MDLNCSINIKYNNNLSSKLQIPYRNKMLGKVSVLGINDTDLISFLKLRISRDLSSVIRINPTNRMSGIVDVVPPPTIKDVLLPTQDAFIREQIPRLNYGIEEDMFVGSSLSGERYRSLIQFNLNAIPQGQEIKKAELILYHATDHTESIDLGLYEAGNSWAEYGVTWDNQPVYKELLTTFKSGKGKSFVKVDVTEIVKSWYHGERKNNGLIIKALNESYSYYSRFCTRESTLSPQLYVEYYDLSATFSVGYNNLYGNALIIGHRYSNIKSCINIKSYWSGYNIPSSIKVSDPKTLECKIIITKIKLPSSLFVVYKGESDLRFNVKVRQKSYYDGVSYINSSKPVLDGFVYVPYHHDLFANITVRATNSDSLESIITISRSFLDGIIDVLYSSNLKSQLTVNVNALIDVTSFIYVLYRKDLNANITVYQNSDLSCFIKVLQDNLFSHLLVRVEEENTLNSIININKVKDIIGKIAVKRFEASDLPAFIFGRFFSDVNSDVIIKVNRCNDLLSYIEVFKGNYYDLQSYLIPRFSNKSGLLSKINIFQVNNLLSSVGIRQYNERNLTGYINIFQVSSFPVRVIIRKSEVNKVLSFLNVRVSASKDLTASMISRVKYISDLFSSIDVFGRNYAYAFIM